MPDQAAVLAANRAFYAVFRRRDFGAMKAIWASRSPLSCIHPGWPPLFGPEDVLGSWQGILSHRETPVIECRDERVVMIGPAQALVVLVEVISGNALAASNVFVREDGEWHIVHHQATPMAEAFVTAGGEAEPEPEPDSGPGRLLH